MENKILVPQELIEQKKKELNESNFKDKIGICISAFFILVGFSFIIYDFVLFGFVVVIISLAIVFFLKENMIDVEGALQNYERVYLENKSVKMRENDFLDFEQKIIEKYGNPDFRECVSFPDFDNSYSRYSPTWKALNGDNIKYDFVYAFANELILVIKCRAIKFSDIVKFEILDNESVFSRGSSSSDSYKTDLGSMVKRVAVGGLVGGVAGAIIGGATAKKVKDDSVEHVIADSLASREACCHIYTLNVTINDFSNPTIVLKMGDDTENANKINGLMNLIMNKNIKSTN